MNMKVKNEIITEIAKPQQLMLTKKKLSGVHPLSINYKDN